MTLIDELKIEIEKLISETDYFLVDLIIRGDKSYRVIEVYIDTEKGITIDECSKIGIEIQSVLNKNYPWQYRLEVSSPGLDKPLKDIRQYKRHIGKNIKISFEEYKLEKIEIGEIKDVKENNIILEKNNSQLEIELPKIKSAIIQTKIKK
ncbi:MAG: hypothetical protein O3A55_01850 [Bacteroidetes bacterium]|nr:hypothetical protein [Bacteroidota bacterium]